MATTTKEVSTYLSQSQLQSLAVINGSLIWRQEDGSIVQVEAICAFPLSYPNKQIVLRGSDQQELGIVEDVDLLKPDICSAIREQLDRRYFLPQVLAIYKMHERFGSAVWDLETDRGRIAISTRQLNEAVRELGPRRFLIVDAEGNRYEIKDLNTLPPESQAHFIGR